MASIGIDLGTTHACVGVWANGKVSVIANDQGFRTTPCIVSFASDDVVVGDSAVAKLHNNAANTVYHLKRVLGKKHKEVHEHDYVKDWSFDLAADTHGAPIAKILDGSRDISSVEFCTIVLRKLKALAEDYTGVVVKNAVLTVPEGYSDEQKALLEEAATAADLSVLRYISEPIAAAIAYGLDEDKKNESKLVVVVDIGGASTDLTLLSIDKGLFNVIATASDHALGGEVFTNSIVEHCVKAFERQKKVTIAADNTRALHRVKVASEQAKKSLSTQSQVTIEVDSLADGQDLIVKLSRSRFEDMVSDHVRKVTKDIAALLDGAGYAKDTIDHVLLVGGSSRIPKAQSAVEDFFDGKKALVSIAPDEAVAFGATVESATLSETADWTLPTDPHNNVEAVPLTLSLGLADGTVYEMIHRGTVLPANVQEVFTTNADNQDAVYLQVYEGQRVLKKDNTLLANLTLSGIPPAPKGESEVEVSFNVTRKGQLTVKAHVRNAEGGSKALVVSSDSSRVVDVDAIVDAAEAAAEEDDAILAELEAKQEAEELAAAVGAGAASTGAQGEDMD
ncbi:hypothetical protein H257_07650 [Aphanomyces astaci]|uniref:Hsp70-like protein n=1 Tax=Aphanomyces astaci TaxID=112090 RepID=W4GGK1_APHAT|nr:hypothetical protein H257_07650 [Aphanomyces astaci]ETV78822.1 hypothetical protein H257_07650 [Aphanomyces astaci]RQM30862.1 hypothetical protein B5M09_008419 [Aphanomyces astaci]|eukprot:XP_009831541.1 hypothetical protein H257_07650 [Aphanomyces astaci]